MMAAARIPELSHVEEIQGIPFFVTTEGRVGTAYRLPVFDAESLDFEIQLAAVRTLISRLKPGVLLRVIHSSHLNPDQALECSRAQALQELQWTQNETLLTVESNHARMLGLWDGVRALLGRNSRSIESEARRIVSSVDHALIRELAGAPLDKDGVSRLFSKCPPSALAGLHSIDAGHEVIGVIRIWRQGVQELDCGTLGGLREYIPKPFEIAVSIRKLTDVRAQYFLQRKRAQLSTSADALAERTLAETEEIAAQTTLSGNGLVEIEWLLILRRSSESKLREDLGLSQRVLGGLGEAYIEIQGAAASFAALCPGTEPHQMFLELDTTAPYFLPLFCRGDSIPKNEPPLRVLPLHRQDGSLYFFDLWRKGYDGANCIINGRRGKGKSVLANLISHALLQDPSIRLVKVDVGGSYAKECELSGGQHVQFNLSEPSGLNPFALLQSTEFVEDAAVVLSGFLSTLLLESRETVLSKEMLSVLEKAVLNYAEASPDRPSIADFLDRSPNLPRRALLERFGHEGVFANVLKEIPGRSALGDNRYTYFNFERLQNAANEDFAQAVMAAVIASVNMEVLRAGDARRGAKNRVVFFADETPFFIQRNGRFFKLTTANFRKFGHATILIAQTTKDFELPKEDGTTDYGILINSPIRFFYQIDDEPGAFAERFGLSARQMDAITNLQRSDQYREVFLQDELGGRVLRVAVTPEEYWRVTSSRSDNEKLQALLKAVPGLDLKEAIRCLACV